MKKILIYMAMQAEAEPLLQQLQLHQKQLLPETLPMKTYSGQYGSAELCLIISGQSALYQVDNIGTEPAAVGLQAGLQVFDADVVINAGTAGGFVAKGAAIGDVYLGKSPVRYHDHRIQIPGFDAYGIGSYACLNCDQMAQVLGLKQGYISTGNALDHTPTDDVMMAANSADCKEMEAAALAWICHVYAKPFIPIKAITDLVDGTEATADEFLHNLNTASEALQKAVKQVITYLCDQA
ncbi:hypothetical protein [Marinicella sp. W31]|uniref:phosphorylase family protein n=1 Tax=Marinicella sp. W31 TaxID=3023713 RepID=UPI003757C5A2